MPLNISSSHTISAIKGLVYIPNFLSAATASSLLNILDNGNRWQSELLSRRIQCYGIHYYYTKVYNPGLQPMRIAKHPLGELKALTRSIEESCGVSFESDEDLENSLPPYSDIVNDEYNVNKETSKLKNDDKLNQCLVSACIRNTSAFLIAYILQ